MEHVLLLTLEHFQIAISAVLIAIVIGLPFGILIARHESLASVVMGITEVLQTIPSLAMLALLMIWLGLGNTTLIVALVLYSLLPIVRNTHTALLGIDKGLIQAGKGMGMTNFQLLRYVELPLALPVMLAGIRVALVTAIGIATIGVLIGAGGLGEVIWRGIQLRDNEMIFSGTIPAALLAILCEYLMTRLELAVTPRGLRIKVENT